MGPTAPRWGLRRREFRSANALCHRPIRTTTPGATWVVVGEFVSLNFPGSREMSTKQPVATGRARAAASIAALGFVSVATGFAPIAGLAFEPRRWPADPEPPAQQPPALDPVAVEPI